MLIVSLIMLLTVMLIVVLVILDSRFMSYFEKTRLGKYTKPVFTMALVLSIIAVASVFWVYKSAYHTSFIPASGDRIIYNQLISNYGSKGVQFSEQASRQPDTKWVKGSNQDHSLNINIFSDSDLDKIKAYQVIVTTSSAGELPVLVHTLLPDWVEGPTWVAQNQNQQIINSTSFQEAHIELCANSEGPNKTLVSYYLGIYPHGYVDI